MSVTLTFCGVYFVVPPVSKPAVVILFLLFAVFTIPLLLMVFLIRIEVEDGVMIVHSPWRRTRRIPVARPPPVVAPAGTRGRSARTAPACGNGTAGGRCRLSIRGAGRGRGRGPGRRRGGRPPRPRGA